jgi:hypothetical protein
MATATKLIMFSLLKYLNCNGMEQIYQKFYRAEKTDFFVRKKGARVAAALCVWVGNPRNIGK